MGELMVIFPISYPNPFKKKYSLIFLSAETPPLHFLLPLRSPFSFLPLATNDGGDRRGWKHTAVEPWFG